MKWRPTRTGLVSQGWLSSAAAKPLAISEAGGTALLPTPFTVAAERYPLSRRLFLYIPANPRNEWTQKFVEFALSELGGPSKLTPTGFFARKFVESALTKLEVFSWWTSGGEVAALNALFDHYKKLYPGVGVINATVAGGSGSAARPILQTRLAVGNPAGHLAKPSRLGVARSVRGAQLLRAGHRPIPE